MTHHIAHWRSVDPFHDDHIAMLHDPRDSITREMRDRALGHLLYSHRWYTTWTPEFVAAKHDGIDDLVGMDT